MIPGAMGMGQALDLQELGPYGNERGAVGKSQGAWAGRSRRTCQGSDGFTVPRTERSPMRRVN